MTSRVIWMTLLLALLATPTQAATMGVSWGQDLDELWARAQADYDLSRQDAVLLLESRHVEISGMDRITTVHRVVWIGSASGIRSYADLRVPWNSDHSTLEVLTLRTWRDDRWWPSEHAVSPTAVVETLPYAMGRAADYAGMRETMLLHDGVELPCILETAYRITERGAARLGGVAGHFVFAQRDPAVRVLYGLSAPGAKHSSHGGAPEPSAETDALLWSLENVPALRTPLLEDRGLCGPYLNWSTWANDETARRNHLKAIEEHATVGEALGDTLSARLEDALTPLARAQAVVALLHEGVRRIRYDDSYWIRSPRPADRVWETAYGHDLDRFTLALALLRAAGLKADPLMLKSRQSSLALEHHHRWLVAVELEHEETLYFDPARDELLGPAEVMGIPGAPIRPSNGHGLTLDLRLRSDGDMGWKGHGMLLARGALSPYARMIGAGAETEETLERTVGAILEGATVEDYNLERLRPLEVDAGFAFTLEAAEPDDRGNVRLLLGDPAGGLLDELPADLHLEQEMRESPLILRQGMRQRMRVRIDLEGTELVHAPEPFELENEMGRFSLRVERNDDMLSVERELVLPHCTMEAESWPALRALLLEEVDPAHRLVLLRLEEE